jgi:hypothetical protein
MYAAGGVTGVVSSILICSIGEPEEGLFSSEGKVAEAGVSKGGRVALMVAAIFASNKLSKKMKEKRKEVKNVYN